MNWLLAPLAYQFMQRGLLASVIVGVLCAVMGTYVVLRGMAFLGDAMAHAILPGVAIAYFEGQFTGRRGSCGRYRSLKYRTYSHAKAWSRKIPPSASCLRRRFRWAWH